MYIVNACFDGKNIYFRGNSGFTYELYLPMCRKKYYDLEVTLVERSEILINFY